MTSVDRTTSVPNIDLISKRFNFDLNALYKIGTKLMAAISKIFNQKSVTQVSVEL